MVKIEKKSQKDQVRFEHASFRLLDRQLKPLGHREIMVTMLIFYEYILKQGYGVETIVRTIPCISLHCDNDGTQVIYDV